MGISSWTSLGGCGISLGADFPGLAGLEDGQREAKVGEVARLYYRTACEAVKAVDPNHLIFGDRFDGNKGIPHGVLDAVKDYVDVLSVQYFCEPHQRGEGCGCWRTGDAGLSGAMGSPSLWLLSGIGAPRR